MVEADREKHVNQCLDKDYSSFKFKPTNKFKRTNSEADEAEKVEKVEKSQDEPRSSKDEEIPQNDESKQKKMSESLLKDAVPNCPICGKVLHTFNVFIFNLLEKFNKLVLL